MYLRFVVHDLDENTGKELGVFQAVGRLRESGELRDYEEEHHDLVLQWFNENLEKAARFTASSPPFYRKQDRTISWFKDSAAKHLAQVRELVVILRKHGVVVETLTTDRVGYVVYEDDIQIVAEPASDEPY